LAPGERGDHSEFRRHPFHQRQAKSLGTNGRKHQNVGSSVKGGHRRAVHLAEEGDLIGPAECGHLIAQLLLVGTLALADEDKAKVGADLVVQPGHSLHQRAGPLGGRQETRVEHGEGGGPWVIRWAALWIIRWLGRRRRLGGKWPEGLHIDSVVDDLCVCGGHPGIDVLLSAISTREHQPTASDLVHARRRNPTIGASR
jgi:hypothetical protein